jgi:hypothetical protein
MQLYDEEKQLLRVPGPLWIDVLVRENFTSDSNAMMVGALKEFAGAYAKFFEGTDQASDGYGEQLSETAMNIISAMNRHLWNDVDDDHFVTQLNPDGTIVDKGFESPYPPPNTSPNPNNPNPQLIMIVNS